MSSSPDSRRPDPSAATRLRPSGGAIRSLDRSESAGVTALKGAEYVLRRTAEACNAAAPIVRERWVWKSLVPEERALVGSNAGYSNKHHGQRAFVCANGPSLAEQDIGPLRDEVAFVLNAFFKHPIVSEWQPDYYCLADPALFDNSDGTNEFFVQLEERCPHSTMFVPLAAREGIRRYGLLKGMDLNYVAFGGYLQQGLRKVPDLTRVVPGVVGVTQMAIMTAMFMGCSPIYLLGFDHDALFMRASLMEGEVDRMPHFYKGEAVRGRANVWSTVSTERLLGDELALYHGYRAIQKVAVQHGIQIFNATRGGFLDVFERADYEEVIATSG